MTTDPTYVVLNTPAQSTLTLITDPPLVYVVVDVEHPQPVLVYGTPLNTVVFLNSRGAAGRAAPESIAVFLQGTTLDGETLLRYNFIETLALSSTLSSASAGIPASANTVLTLYNGNVVIGTITFAANATNGTFSIVTPHFNAGDALSVIAPSSSDLTLADIALTLVGD